MDRRIAGVFNRDCYRRLASPALLGRLGHEILCMGASIHRRNARMTGTYA